MYHDTYYNNMYIKYLYTYNFLINNFEAINKSYNKIIFLFSIFVFAYCATLYNAFEHENATQYLCLFKKKKKETLKIMIILIRHRCSTVEISSNSVFNQFMNGPK